MYHTYLILTVNIRYYHIYYIFFAKNLFFFISNPLTYFIYEGYPQSTN